MNLQAGSILVVPHLDARQGLCSAIHHLQRTLTAAGCATYLWARGCCLLMWEPAEVLTRSWAAPHHHDHARPVYTAGQYASILADLCF